MNHGLRRLADEICLDEARFDGVRLSFGLACVNRVRHLLEDSRAIEALVVCARYLEGDCGEPAFEAAARAVIAAARSHPGSSSIDGTGHAAVSATQAVACALEGRAVDAAEYAAYASVYSYSTHAVNDPSSFGEEYAWQRAELERQWRSHESGSSPGQA